MDNGHDESQDSHDEVVNGAEDRTKVQKPVWKAKRDEWVKPEISESKTEISDSVTEEEASTLECDSTEQRRSVSPGRKKSLPPIKVPEKSADIPQIVSRAMYNRCVLTALMEWRFYE
jgi:hypothetical protein